MSPQVFTDVYIFIILFFDPPEKSDLQFLTLRTAGSQVRLAEVASQAWCDQPSTTGGAGRSILCAGPCTASPPLGPPSEATCPSHSDPCQQSDPATAAAFWAAVSLQLAPSQTQPQPAGQPEPPGQPDPAQPNQTPASSQTQPQPQPFGLPCSRPQPFGLPCNHPQPFGLPWYPAGQAWKEEPLRPGRASCFSILITRVKRKTLARGTKPQKPERITSFRLESSS